MIAMSGDYRLGTIPDTIKFPTVKEVEVTNDELIRAIIMDNTRLSKHKVANVVRFFVLLANGISIRQSAKQTGLLDRTVRRWKDEEWFNVVLDAVVQSLDAQLDHKLTGIVHKGMDQVADRIENGDFVLDKRGNQVRKPMNGRDLAVTTAVIFDKRQLLRDKPTQIQQVSAEERLSALGDKFRSFSQAVEIDGEVVEDAEES